MGRAGAVLWHRASQEGQEEDQSPESMGWTAGTVSTFCSLSTQNGNISHSYLFPPFCLSLWSLLPPPVLRIAPGAAHQPHILSLLHFGRSLRFLYLTFG